MCEKGVKFPRPLRGSFHLKERDDAPNRAFKTPKRTKMESGHQHCKNWRLFRFWTELKSERSEDASKGSIWATIPLLLTIYHGKQTWKHFCILMRKPLNQNLHTHKMIVMWDDYITIFFDNFTMVENKLESIFAFLCLLKPLI